MDARPLNVLFLCSGNSARSIMAESLLNGLGRGRFRAFSAGSQPTGVVNRFARELLDAPCFDFVITVCDRTAAEACPAWRGEPVMAHWSIKDPAKAEGDVEAKQRAFFHAYNELQTRVLIFVNLPLESLDPGTLRQRLDDIGKESVTLTA